MEKRGVDTTKAGFVDGGGSDRLLRLGPLGGLAACVTTRGTVADVEEGPPSLSRVVSWLFSGIDAAGGGVDRGETGGEGIVCPGCNKVVILERDDSKREGTANEDSSQLRVGVGPGQTEIACTTVGLDGLAYLAVTGFGRRRGGCSSYGRRWQASERRKEEAGILALPLGAVCLWTGLACCEA
jgi:hypothetical protein